MINKITSAKKQSIPGRKNAGKTCFRHYNTPKPQVPKDAKIEAIFIYIILFVLVEFGSSSISTIADFSLAEPRFN